MELGKNQMRKSFKYRIYPNKEQETLIQKTFGCVRFVYNHFLEKSITEYRNKGQRWSRLQQDKALTILKKELVWLREPDKCALQNSLRDLDDAYQSFFRKVKCGDNPGFPKFKSKKKEKKSYKTSNNGNSIRLGKNEIHFLKLGWVKAKITRDIPQGYRPISATISQDPSGKYYAAIVTEYEFDAPKIPLDATNALGLDYSSPHFYVDSEGTWPICRTSIGTQRNGWQESNANCPRWSRAATITRSRKSRWLVRMRRFDSAVPTGSTKKAQGWLISTISSALRTSTIRIWGEA